jgi:hypothetical protein
VSVLFQARPKSKWIYVLDVHNRFYINKKQACEFHHSSFTRSGPVRAAGSIIVDDGRVRQITAWSGHYRPTEQDFDEVIAYLGSRGVDMSQASTALCLSNAYWLGRKFQSKHSSRGRVGVCKGVFVCVCE